MAIAGTQSLPGTVTEEKPRPRGWHESEIKLTRKQKMNLAFSTMRTVRTTWESRYADVAAHSDPYGFLITPLMANMGFRKDQALLDTTGLDCRKILKSGMFTSVTPSGSDWYTCRHPNPQINKNSAVKKWNEAVADVMKRVDEVGNFYRETPKYFDKGGTYGACAILMEEDIDAVANYTVFPTGSWWCSVNKDGIADTFVLNVRMTVREVIDKFCTDPFTGQINLDNCSKALTNYYNSHMYEAGIDLIYFLGPRKLYGGTDGKGPDGNDLPGSEFKPGSPIRKEMEYGFWVYEWSLNAEAMTAMENSFGDVFLMESGFEDFPAFVTPWDTTSKLDAYGNSSPGLDALPDMRELFFTRSQLLMVEEKLGNPTMTGSTLSNAEDYTSLPGEFNPETGGQGGEKNGLRPAYEVPYQAVELLSKRLAELQDKVKEVWDTKTFQLLSSFENMKDVTATAVLELKREKLQKLGAIYGTFNDHFLKPRHKILFKWCWRRGLIPPPPKEYGNYLPMPELMGVMAEAMRLSNLAASDRLMEFAADKLGKVVAIPALANEINPGRILREYADTLNTPEGFFNTDEEKEQLQAAQAKIQQQQQMAENLPKMAGAAKDLGNTPVDENSALSNLLNVNAAGGPGA
jgi:hypothetical protein